MTTKKATFSKHAMLIATMVFSFSVSVNAQQTPNEDTAKKGVPQNQENLTTKQDVTQTEGEQTQEQAQAPLTKKGAQQDDEQNQTQEQEQPSQDAVQKDDDQKDEDIEVIVVTAQKRVQRIEDVPLAVSAVSGYTIENTFSNNIEALPRLVPSLNFRKGTTTRNSALFLRGLGTISFSIAAEPSVATVIDGVVYARSGQAFSDFYDLERVEILRGPQGTLFGKNASAGVITMTTRHPSDELEAEVLTSFYELREFRTRVSVSGPITPDLRVRLTGFSGTFDGYIQNVYFDEKVNGYSRQGLRALVDWTPDVTFLGDGSLQFTLIGDYATANDDCCAEILGAGPADPNSPMGKAVRESLGPHAIPQGVDSRTVNQNLRSTTLDETFGISLQADISALEHTLTSITAYREWDNTELRDGDFLSVGAAYVDLSGTSPNSMFELHDTGVQEFRQFSQELRLASKTGKFFEYQVGLFYFHVESDRKFTRDDVVCTNTTAPADDTGLQPCIPGLSDFAYPSATATFGSEFDNFAAFGHATLNILDDFRVIGGFRYTRDELSYFHRRVNNSNGVGGPGVKSADFPDTGGKFTGSTGANGFSGKAILQYDFIDDANVFVSYARGYKGPAFNIFFNFDESDSLPIDPETSNAFELGVKGSILDRRLYFSANTFYQMLDNFQANNFVNLNNTIVTKLTNAGEVSTMGFELEVTARPISDLFLTGGLAFTDAQIDKFKLIAGAPADATDRAGERLPLAPEWRLVLSGDYRLPVDSLPFNTYLNTQFSWQSEQYSSLGEDPALEIASYAVWDASINFVSKDGNITFSFLVRNLLDESFATLITPGGQAGTYRYLIPREASRFVGASLRLKI